MRISVSKLKWFVAPIISLIAIAGCAAVTGTRSTGDESVDGFQPYGRFDTSGFAAVSTQMPPAPEGSSLGDIARIWTDPGAYLAREAEKKESKESQDLDQRVRRLVTKAGLLNFEANPAGAYKLATQARQLALSHPETARRLLYSTIFVQGVTSLRQGENDNCIQCRGKSACILPIEPSAVHLRPAGSRQAIVHFTEYLDRFPKDYGARWLLNIAHMTLGGYPEKVAPKYLLLMPWVTLEARKEKRFTDISHLVGLNRQNQAGGVVLDDLDNDGLIDVALTSMDPTMEMDFLRNTGNGGFESRAAAAGLKGQFGGLNAVQTDFNNDGNLDIFVVRGAWISQAIRPSLLRNDGGGRFTDVTQSAGLGTPLNSISSCWADFDNDGFLDVFVCCERQPNRLYRNLGNGKFQNVAGVAGISEEYSKLCKGATWIDIDNDDYPDLFLNYLDGDAKLFRNRGDGTFTDATTAMGIKGPNGGFACWTWDYNNDGWQDLFATCYDRRLDDIVKGLLNEPHQLHSNALYRNNQGKGFTDVTKEAGLDMVFATMGCNFADYDNDGFLDMYLGTGDPDLATLIPNRMFHNESGARFRETTGETRTGHLQKGHGTGFADWDHDGDLDLFIQTGGATNGDRYHNLLFQNPGKAGNWISVRCAGKKSNRPGIGVRLKITTAGPHPRTIYRHIGTGASFGSNPLTQLIGVGAATGIASLEAHWPTSGATQQFHDLPVNKAFEIVEFAETVRYLPRKRLPSVGAGF